MRPAGKEQCVGGEQFGVAKLRWWPQNGSSSSRGCSVSYCTHIKKTRSKKHIKQERCGSPERREQLRNGLSISCSSIGRGRGGLQGGLGIAGVATCRELGPQPWQQWHWAEGSGDVLLFFEVEQRLARRWVH